ncbi:unnamed protein product [Ceratitis capitata]|uniref:(Mediterranean fruit fly) hypothetical protein n=1 Tax=Ceratitis capitata TaxID=7213 RepID=A0A811UBH9_CERCA|nr:unnamed protein product [Ceratitis capitata]
MSPPNNNCIDLHTSSGDTQKLRESSLEPKRSDTTVRPFVARQKEGRFQFKSVDEVQAEGYIYFHSAEGRCELRRLKAVVEHQKEVPYQFLCVDQNRGVMMRAERRSEKQMSTQGGHRTSTSIIEQHCVEKTGISRTAVAARV